MAVGGSIESVSIKGRTFPVASDAAATRKLGGFENELRANGDSTVRIIKTRMPWGVEGIVLECDDVRQDQEFLQDISDRNDFVDITMTLVSGLTYQGTGTLYGEVTKDEQSATVTVTFGGPGRMTSQ